MPSSAIYTAAIVLATTPQPNVYCLEEVMRLVAQRFGEWGSASRTSSTITDLLAVVQREFAKLLVFIFWSMHAPPPPDLPAR